MKLTRRSLFQSLGALALLGPLARIARLEAIDGVPHIATEETAAAFWVRDGDKIRHYPSEHAWMCDVIRRTAERARSRSW